MLLISRRDAQADQESHAPYHHSRSGDTQVQISLVGIMQRRQGKGRPYGAMKPRCQESAEPDQGREAAKSKPGHYQDKTQVKHDSPRSSGYPMLSRAR